MLIRTTNQRKNHHKYVIIYIEVIYLNIKDDILKELQTINDEESQKNNTILTSDFFLKENNNFVIFKNSLLTTDKSVHLRKHPRFVDYPTHTHSYIECAYVISGSVTHIINSKEVVVNEGDFIIFTTESSHAIQACSTNDIAINFIVKPIFISQMLETCSGNKDLSHFITQTQLQNPKHHYYHFKAIPDNLKAIVHTMINHYFSNDLPQGIHLLFSYVLIELFTKNLILQQHHSPYDTEYLILYTKQYIEKEYYNGSLETLSNLLNTNYSYLSSCIKKEFGKSFKQLQQQKRLDVALTLIQKSQLPVKEIAFMVGYENMTFFYKIFKQQYSKNPNAFRKTNT